ncbi:hypothetical protein [Peribacillus frigoritolerans]|uniref:hypothetical protein n=1 Tax=Peribacillus frigoritolerans TaxID=450367 RepID=UPI00227E83FB|nr:hypothetical protein [Peribacillus frigoritolerans]MCY9007173.1 hypothetical protein [Peribacillus frigoritolerans]
MLDEVQEIKNGKLESIFKNIESKVNNIDSNILEECLNEFEYSDFNVSFYSNGIDVSNSEDVNIDDAIKNSIMEIIDERIDYIKDLYIEAYITHSTYQDLYSPGYDENVYNRFNSLIELAKEKRLVLLRLKAKFTVK